MTQIIETTWFHNASVCFCERFPFSCNIVAGVLQWFLERDTRMWEVTVGVLGNLGVALWIGWPGFHPFVGKSEFYQFLMRHFGDWKWPFLLFLFLGIGHCFILLCSQVTWGLAPFLHKKFGSIDRRALLCFFSAAVWYMTFKLYHDDAVGGAAAPTSLCFCCGFSWSYLCLTLGRKPRYLRLMEQIKRDLRQES